ncbi:hypothetical protein Focb16_v014389 [Fusarium oxysporum f. sp. cubense]|uniref:Uncharacterized protein n=1 Tax=Fusarium oxysporum f. sp. cubense TaxID=61366 RepID=A0A559KV32_FUSOC|nr:hypothetical protein Focb16_v014389 [Fusarium oxysporum f. sp. cubense]
MSDAQSNKRRASGTHEDEPVKKKGRPSRADLDSHADRDAMNRVQARRMLRRHTAVGSTSDGDGFDYENLVSWCVEGHWGEEDDAAVDEQWDQSELKESTKNLNSPQYASLFKLFRISLRLFKTAPNAIISPLFGLRYQAVSKNSLSNEWVMSMTFCEQLMKLMVHPCWEQDRELLVLALQWTVICRLDSRRRWLSGGFPKPCPVLQPLFEEIQDYKAKRLSLSYHEMHEQARDHAIREGKSPSEFSDLLYQVGEAVYEDKKSRPKVEPGADNLWGLLILPLTNWDLRVLSNAVNSTKFRPEWRYSVEDALKGWKAENSGHELPTQDKLSLVYRLSQMNVFRHIRVQLRQPLTDADDHVDQLTDPFLSSEGNKSEQDQDQVADSFPSSDKEPEQETSPVHRKGRRRTVVDDSSEEEAPLVQRATRPLPKSRRRHVSTDDEDEDSAPVRSSDSDLPSDPQPDLEGEEDDMAGTVDDGANLDFGEFLPQATKESDEFRPRGPTLAESLPPHPPASPIYASLREKKMLSELSELRKENRELREGQKKLRGLFADGVKRQNELIVQSSNLMLQAQKEQKELMLNMQKQLESMQSELSELRQAKEAPNRGDNVQRPPEVTVTSDSAPKSPELGTIPSALHNDVVSLEEATSVEPMDEDIPPEQAVPKQKTPEPETSEQPVATVQEQAPQPVSTDTNPSKEGEGRTQVVSQLPGAIAETPSTSTEKKASDQSSALPPWPVLPPNPPMPRRNIPRLACTGAGRFPVTSDAHDVFVTPRSEVLKILKGYN